LAVARNLAGELLEIDHLADGFAGFEPFYIHPDLEITRRVLPCAERGGTAQQTKLGWNLCWIDRQQRAFAGGLVIHLQRAHDLHESALALHIHRFHLAGRKPAAARVHRLLEGEQQRARAEHRARERNDHRVAIAPPIAAHALAGDIDVADPFRHRDFPLGRGRTHDEEVHQHTAIDRAGLERIEVEHVGLDALVERLDG